MEEAFCNLFVGNNLLLGKNITKNENYLIIKAKITLLSCIEREIIAPLPSICN